MGRVKATPAYDGHCQGCREEEKPPAPRRSHLSLSGELLSQEHRRETPWPSSRITVCNALIAAVLHGRGVRKSRGRKTKRRRNAEPNAQQRSKPRPTMTRRRGEVDDCRRI